jgi:hypothetical protein
LYSNWKHKKNFRFLGESFLKISFLKVIGFLRIIFGGIKAGFHWDKYLSTGLEFKKKEVD